MLNKINKIVKKYWGYDTLKDKQIEVITNFINGKDVIGLLPTGYGKSLCYLIPPLIKKKIIFIISPLISLMEDQKEKLIELKIPVACLHGNNFNKQKEIFEIIDGNIAVVYMSPEFLINGEGLELATTLDEEGMLGFLAIDESHCISVWGHDFRSEYLKIKNFRILFPHIPILAVTATATQRVVEEIAQYLTLNNPIIVSANFDRPNLYLKCIAVENTNIDILKEWIKKYESEKIIIYTNSRKETTELSKKINNIYGDISIAYHAGMTKKMRHIIQTKFSSGEYNIIVSTVAFGMGIDQVVRCVLIFGAPSSIEEYYQMIGRAGRDGLDAETILFFQYKNIVIGKSMYDKNNSNLSEEITKSKKRGLDIMAKYFYIQTCRRRFIIEYFGQIPKFFTCKKCDNCCEKEYIDYTDRIKKVIFDKEKWTDVFNKNELDIFVKNDLIKEYNKIYIIKESLKNWEKIIKINNKINNIPEKYKIKL
jgi:ATP-dependent DNA helicase RecQ